MDESKGGYTDEQIERMDKLVGVQSANACIDEWIDAWKDSA